MKPYVLSIIMASLTLSACQLSTISNPQNTKFDSLSKSEIRPGPKGTQHATNSDLEQSIRPGPKGTQHMNTPQQSIRPGPKGTQHISGIWRLPKVTVPLAILNPTTTDSVTLPPLGLRLLSIQSTGFQQSALNQFIAQVDGVQYPLSLHSYNVGDNQITLDYQILEVKTGTNRLLEFNSPSGLISFKAVLKGASEQTMTEQSINSRTTAQAILLQERALKSGKTLKTLNDEEFNVEPHLDALEQLIDATFKQGQGNVQSKAVQEFVSETVDELIQLDKTTEVKVSDKGFSASQINIEVGQLIQWVLVSSNESDTLISRDNLFPNQVLAPDQKFSYAFTRKGTYRFKLEKSASTFTVVVE